MTSKPFASGHPYLTCRQVLEFLMKYLEGGLSSHERSEFDRHLAVCPSCVNYLESYKRTIELGRSLGELGEASTKEPVPERLLRAVREARRKGH